VPAHGKPHLVARCTAGGKGGGCACNYKLSAIQHLTGMIILHPRPYPPSKVLRLVICSLKEGMSHVFKRL
jgi:hypothetical protein